MCMYFTSMYDFALKLPLNKNMSEHTDARHNFNLDIDAIW
jgi:hypothetical protein